MSALVLAQIQGMDPGWLISLFWTGGEVLCLPIFTGAHRPSGMHFFPLLAGTHNHGLIYHLCILFTQIGGGAACAWVPGEPGWGSAGWAGRAAERRRRGGGRPVLGRKAPGARSAQSRHTACNHFTEVHTCSHGQCIQKQRCSRELWMGVRACARGTYC